MTIPELAFELTEVVPERYAATPTLGLRVALRRGDGGPVQCVVLTTTVTIAAPRRGYDAAAQDRLAALFGAPEQWDRSLRALHWARVTATVPAFTGGTELTLPVACGHDLQIAAMQYIHALRDGDVPIELAFSGTMFYPDDAGALRSGQISWCQEAAGGFPVRTWRRLMSHYYGSSRWLRLQEEGFDRLAAYKTRNGLGSFDEAVADLLRVAENTRHGALHDLRRDGR